MFYYLIAALGFIFVFGLVVFVHEGGHFLLARLNGVEVEAFALGMGPPLFSYAPGETEYRICVVPLGGYVKLAGEDITEETDNPRAFSNQPVLRRMSVLVAGVICNILLGFLLYVPYGMVQGEEILPPRIGFINEDMPAYGELQIGDEVLALNERPIERFQDINVHNSLLGDEERRFLIRRDGEKKMVVLEPHRLEDRSIFQPTHVVGISPYLPPEIEKLGQESILRDKNFERGDRFVKIAGTEVRSFQHFSHLLTRNRGEVEIVLERQGEQLMRTLNVPEADEDFYDWARKFQWEPPVPHTTYGFLESMNFALRETKNAVQLLFRGIWGLITRRLSPDGLAGPVGIIGVTGHIATIGFWPLINFTAFLSINLGVINILPVPVLDGGHILLSLPELVGYKLPAKAFDLANQIGLALLLALLIMVTFFDIARIDFVNRLFSRLSELVFG